MPLRNETDKPPKSASDRLVNRHMARLLDELQDAGCPAIFREAVKSEMVWLRSDLNEMEAQDGRIHETGP